MDKKYRFIVGAGKGEINFTPEILPHTDRETYTRILDKPCIRMVIMQQCERYVFVAAELANMDRDVQREILQLIEEKAGVDAEHIFFHMNHVHSTPHGWAPFERDRMSDEEKAKVQPFYSTIRNAAELALDAALASMREAVVGTGRGVCSSCIVNRNVNTAEGWWLGSGEDGVKDESVGIIRFDDLRGQTIAILYIYNVVPSIFDYSTRDFEPGLERTVSADLAGYASACIEDEFPGAVAIYCTGAAGDVWPSFSAMYNVVGRGGKLRTKDVGGKAFVLAQLQGDRLGQQVVIAADDIECHELQGKLRIEFDSVSFEGRREHTDVHKMGPLKELEFVSCGEERELEMPFFFIGDEAVFIGLHCQLGVKTVMRVQNASPLAVTGLLSFSTVGERHGKGVRKYMPEKDAYEKIQYCAQNSVVMPGSAEKLGDSILAYLNK